MVQEFCVLRCYNCRIFQVHIVKKAKTWKCKICNSKQSIVKVFGQGTAKDCRVHVQKLNVLLKIREDGDAASEECFKETAETMTRSPEFSICDADYLPVIEQFNPPSSKTKREYNDTDCNISKKNKWDCYFVNEKMDSLVEQDTIMKENRMKTENLFFNAQTIAKSKWDSYLEDKKDNISLETSLKGSCDDKIKNSAIERNPIENHSQNSCAPFEKLQEAVKLDVTSNSKIIDENKVFNLFNAEREEIDDLLNL